MTNAQVQIRRLTFVALAAGCASSPPAQDETPPPPPPAPVAPAPSPAAPAVTAGDAGARPDPSAVRPAVFDPNKGLEGSRPAS
jgi:hypothetical protein